MIAKGLRDIWKGAQANSEQVPPSKETKIASAPPVPPSLLVPSEYIVRLYLLDATHLRNRDVDLGHGFPAAQADPYFRVSLAGKVFDDSKLAHDNTSDCDWYKLYEFHQVKLPGSTELKIECMDYDTFGLDDLIGETVIDLEDRLYDPRWQIDGIAHQVVDLEPNRSRYRPLSVENRTLTCPPNKQAEQGRIRCWVEIMTRAESIRYPTTKIGLEKDEEYELRVIIWSAKNLTGCMQVQYSIHCALYTVHYTPYTIHCTLYTVHCNHTLYAVHHTLYSHAVRCTPYTIPTRSPQDLYVNVSLQDEKSHSQHHSTDTHWRCKSGGKGSFNYRMKFPIKLSRRSFLMKNPNLTLELWDKVS
jgi:hypothetical protein